MHSEQQPISRSHVQAGFRTRRSAKSTFIDPGAIDDDVEPPECRLGLRKEPLDIGRLGDVGLDRDRPASVALDLGHHTIGAFLARRIVDNYGGAGRCQMFGDGGSDPLRCPVTMATLPSSLPSSVLMRDVLLRASAIEMASSGTRDSFGRMAQVAGSLARGGRRASAGYPGWQHSPCRIGRGTSNAGFRSKKPRDWSTKPMVVTGITGQSSGRTTCWESRGCQTTVVASERFEPRAWP